MFQKILDLEELNNSIKHLMEKGGLIRRHFIGRVYLFKPEDSAYFVHLRFRKSEIYCRMAISRNGKFDISVSPKELYKVYQYINECIIKEKAYDSRNNNQEE